MHPRGFVTADIIAAPRLLYDAARALNRPTTISFHRPHTKYIEHARTRPLCLVHCPTLRHTARPTHTNPSCCNIKTTTVNYLVNKSSISVQELARVGFDGFSHVSQLSCLSGSIDTYFRLTILLLAPIVQDEEQTSQKPKESMPR